MIDIGRSKDDIVNALDHWVSEEYPSYMSRQTYISPAVVQGYHSTWPTIPEIVYNYKTSKQISIKIKITPTITIVYTFNHKTMTWVTGYWDSQRFDNSDPKFFNNITQYLLDQGLKRGTNE